jgi:hypothetical protein
LTPDTVALRYRGLDGLERDTTLRFEPAPLRLDAQYAQFVLTLKGGEGKRIVLRISCRAPAKQAWNIREYYRALRASRDALRPALAPIAGDLARWLDDRNAPGLLIEIIDTAGSRARAPSPSYWTLSASQLEPRAAVSAPRRRGFRRIEWDH